MDNLLKSKLLFFASFVIECSLVLIIFNTTSIKVFILSILLAFVSGLTVFFLIKIGIIIKYGQRNN